MKPAAPVTRILIESESTGGSAALGEAPDVAGLAPARLELFRSPQVRDGLRAAAERVERVAEVVVRVALVGVRRARARELLHRLLQEWERAVVVAALLQCVALVVERVTAGSARGGRRRRWRRGRGWRDRPRRGGGWGGRRRRVRHGLPHGGRPAGADDGARHHLRRRVTTARDERRDPGADCPREDQQGEWHEDAPGSRSGRGPQGRRRQRGELRRRAGGARERTPQLGHELTRRGEPPARILREPALEDRVDLGRQVLAPLRDRRHGGVHVRRRLGRRGVALERPVAAEQLARDHGEGVEVARGRGALAHRLLRGEVPSGAEDGAGKRHRVETGRARDPEGGNAELITLVQQQVRRLDVAVDDAVGGRRVERGPGLLEPRQRPRWRLRALLAQPVLKRPPGEVLHHDERATLPLADVEDRDRAGLAREPRGRQRLALEPLADRVVPRVALGEHLDRHLAAERRVGGQVDVAHGTAPDAFGRAVPRWQERSVHGHRDPVPRFAAPKTARYGRVSSVRKHGKTRNPPLPSGESGRGVRPGSLRYVACRAHEAMVSTLAAAVLAALGLSGAPAGHATLSAHTVPAKRAAPVARHAAAKPAFFLAGHGWGHGVGLAQYGAYGYALHGWSYDDIVLHYYPGTTLGQAPLKRVRVLLVAGARHVTVSSASAFTVKDAAGRTHKLAAGRQELGPGLKLKLVAAKTKPLPGPLVFSPGDDPLALGGQAYRGSLRITGGRSLRVVNTVGLEQYLWGVVPREMPDRWPAQALQAQAVVARTYALTHLAKGGDFDLYDDTRSQVYGGVAAESDSAREAVDGSAGEVVLYKGA